MLGKFKQADLVLKTKQPTADSGKGGLVMYPNYQSEP